MRFALLKTVRLRTIDMSDSKEKKISFTLNGRSVTASIQPHWTLVELLQNRFDLFGARKSCGQGLCGCCTVILNGSAVTGCLFLAALADGAAIETIEQSEEQLDTVQEAFIEAGAFQCGFCTSGFILMARQLLAADPNPSDEDIRQYLSGNLCRCGAYPQIIDAVKLAASRIQSANS